MTPALTAGTDRASTGVRVQSTVTVTLSSVLHARWTKLHAESRGISAPGYEPVMNLGCEPH